MGEVGDEVQFIHGIFLVENEIGFGFVVGKIVLDE